MKRILTIFAAVLAGGMMAFAPTVEFNEDADRSIRKGVFSTEFVSYEYFGDHYFLNADQSFLDNKGRVNSEFVLNLVELRINPYESGMFSIGVDLAWDYYRLNKDHLWLPTSDKTGVDIASREASGFSKIKRSNLTVRSVSIPVSFEQNFGKCDLRIGIAGEYNYAGVSKFKAIDNNGTTIKETKSGERFSDSIKVRPFTYNVFGALSFGGLGLYVRYNPMPQFEEGFGPQFEKTLTFGLVCGLGM